MLGETARRVPAVVGVGSAVENAVVQGERLGGAQAGVTPHQLAGAEAGGDTAVEDARPIALGRHIELRLVADQRLHDRPGRQPVRVLGHRLPRAGVQGDQRGLQVFVDQLEVTADDDLAVLGRGADGAYRSLDLRLERQQRTPAGERHDALPLPAVDGREVASQVDRALRDVDGPYGRRDLRAEVLAQRAACRVERDRIGRPGLARVGERAADVEHLAVRGRLERPYGVSGAGEAVGARQQFAGDGVEGREVLARDLPLAGLGTRRTDLVEGPADVHDAACVLDRPDDAVGLPGRQGVGGQGLFVAVGHRGRSGDERGSREEGRDRSRGGPRLVLFLRRMEHPGLQQGRVEEGEMERRSRFRDGLMGCVRAAHRRVRALPKLYEIATNLYRMRTIPW